MDGAEAIRAFEKAGWQKAAATYEGFAKATRQFIPALLDAAGVEEGRRVLDVACGPGFLTAEAAKRGGVARGLDFSPAMLDVARRLHPRIAFDEGDAEALPYDDASFGCVVSNFGVHHVPRPALALKEAFRVLRPGGRVTFSFWAAPVENIAWKLVFDAIRRVGDPAASRAPPPGGGFGAPENCAAALVEAGFSSVETRRENGVWHHADGRALLEAFRGGTARMAALIECQPAGAVEAIAADIEAAAMAYRQDGELRLPIAAYVTHGVKQQG